MNDRSHLPPAVRKQAELAEKIAAQLKNPSNEAPNPAEEAKVLDQEQTEKPQVADVPKVESSPEKDNDASYWRNRFSVVEGKYKSEVPRLSQEVNTLKQTIQELNSKAAIQPAQGVDANDVLDKFTKAEREEYGDDLIELVTKVAAQMSPTSSPEITEIKQHMAEVKDDKDTEQKTQHLQRQEIYLADIDRGMPDWKAINATPQWIEWLNGLDPFTGTRRQKALDDAQTSLNAKQIIHIFSEFKTTHPSSNVPSSQVLPDSVAGDPTLSEVQPITRQFIADFYADKRKGVYRGKDAEAAVIEGQINNAVSKGKVRD